MRSFSLLVPMAFATFALAQSPQSFNYQGVARDAVGEPLSAQAIGVEFRLRSGSALGPVVYSETHGATTDMFGLFTLHVGEGTPGTGTFSTIDWRSGPYFLEIGLDLSASGIYTSFGTQKLLSVPYALHAGSSGDLPPGTEVGQIMHWDGGAWVADSGLYAHDKRFGIGTTTPECPLGIKGEPGQDDAMISFHSEDDSQKWNINLNPSGGDVDGFSIDDASSGLSQSRLFIADSTGHVGIGDTVPEAPLAIKSRNILKTYFETGDIPTQDNFGISTDSAGFDIGQGAPSALQSRLFIQAATGNVGLGTLTPAEKLHIEASTSSGVTGLRILNTATAANQGFTMGQLQDPLPGRNGSLLIFSDSDADQNDVVVRWNGNVGINEGIPDTKLHVSRPVSDPSSALDLMEGTGIVTIGPITDNIVADHRGIQARHGEYAGGSTLSLSTAPLNLQRLGGDILIHGADPMDEHKVAIDSLGNLGLGTIEPIEKLDVSGAIKIGNSSNQENGTIRWTGTDFEGRKAGQWNSLTTNTDDFMEGTTPGAIGYDPVGVEGSVGIGTLDPLQKLHVSGANDGGNVSIMVENLESSADGGWLMSAVEDNTVPARMKTFAVHEKIGSELSERITVLSSRNVGINEVLPYATLHVSRPASEPLASVGLAENTGILCLGQITDNIAADYRGIQARHGEYVGGGPTLSLSTATLNLQRLGGDILIHGDDAVVSHQVTVTSDGKIGVGKTATEKLDINGAIVIGNTTTASPAPGSIRFNGTEFEAWKAGDWAIFDGTLWGKVDNTDAIYYDAGSVPRIAIGSNTASATLDVTNTEATTGGSTAAVIRNHAANSGSGGQADHRIGLLIENQSSWGGDPLSKNIGLYISEVSGQSAPSSNLAAVINGNVVVGGVTSSQLVGTNGTNVLAIQNGTPPADGLSGGPGSNGAIQFYSADLSGVSTIHVMNGNGDVIKLYREAPITPAQNLPVDGIYDPSEAIVIENMRTRITELENVLKALGLLTP